MRIVLFCLCALIAPALIYGWWSIYHLACWVLILPAAVALVLFDYSRVSRQAHRNVIASGYFKDGSLLHAIAGSSLRIAVLSIVSAVVFTVALFATLPNWSETQLWLLMANGVVIALLYGGFLKLADRLAVQPAFTGILARRWTVAINTLIGVAALAYLAWTSPPPPELLAGTLSEARAAATNPRICDCPEVGFLVTGQADLEVLGLWTAKGLSAFMTDGALNLIVWLPYLLSGTLVMAAYSRLAVRLMDMARYTRGEAENG